MADVSEPFMLCGTLQKDSLVGIEADYQKSHVILTFKDRGVLVYNLENKKIIHSLPVQQRREFTSSVVQDPRSKKYIGVLDNLNICQWSENAGNLDECQQNKVEHQVAQILVGSRNITEPVVVFKDGSCTLLSKCVTKAKKTRRRSTLTSSRIVSSSILHHNNTSVVAVAKYKDAQLSVSLSKLTMDADVQSIAEWSIEPPGKDITLLNCCFEASNANLISYWSNGFLCVTELCVMLNSFSLDGSQDKNFNLTCRCIHRLQVNAKTAKKPVSMATMDSTHICMCHESQTENGVHETLSIYDTKFGTRQACVPLEKLTGEKSLTSSSSGSMHILCTDGYICTGFKHGVAVCSYTVKESSLATALGKLAPSSRSSDVTPIKPLLCIPQLPDPSKDLKDWIDSTNTSQTTEDQMLTRLTNPGKTKTIKVFTQQLNQYLDSKCLNKGKDEGDPTDTVRKTSLKAKEKNKSKFLLSQHFVLTVLSRCLEETKFFPKEALTNLIKTRCIPGSSSPDLLKHLTEKHEGSMILVCLKNIQGIPESALVSCLQYVIQADSSVFGDEEKPEDNESDKSEKEMETEENAKMYQCPFGKKRSNLLCHLLSYPVNDVFIQESIKKLTSPNVTALMKFLAYIIHTAPRTSFARDDSPLDYATALDWTGWIVNAHYTSLVLMSDIHQLLRDVSKSVDNQVALFERLSRLEGFLLHYKYKQTLPNNDKPGLYTVEMLEL